MVIEELIHEDDKPTLMRALLLRHRHVNENTHGGFPFGSKRKFSSYTSLQVSKTFYNFIKRSKIIEIISHSGSCIFIIFFFSALILIHSFFLKKKLVKTQLVIRIHTTKALALITILFQF